MFVIEAYKFKVRNYVLNAHSYKDRLFVSCILKKTCERDLTNIPLFVRTSTGQSSRCRKIRNPSWSWFPPQGGGPRSSWGGAVCLSPPWLRTNCTTSFWPKSVQGLYWGTPVLFTRKANSFGQLKVSTFYIVTEFRHHYGLPHRCQEMGHYSSQLWIVEMFTKHVSQVSHVICGSKNVYQAIEFECMYGICSFSEGIHISVCAREMYQTHSKVEHLTTYDFGQ